MKKKNEETIEFVTGKDGQAISKKEFTSITNDSDIYTELLDLAMNEIKGDADCKTNFLKGVAHNKPWWINKWATDWVNKTSGAIVSDHDFKKRRLNQAISLLNSGNVADNIVYAFIDKHLNQGIEWYSFHPRYDDRVKHSNNVDHLVLLNEVMQTLNRWCKDEQVKEDFFNSVVYNQPWWLDVDNDARRNLIDMIGDFDDIKHGNFTDKHFKETIIFRKISEWISQKLSWKNSLYGYVDDYFNNLSDDTLVQYNK